MTGRDFRGPQSEQRRHGRRALATGDRGRVRGHMRPVARRELFCLGLLPLAAIHRPAWASSPLLPFIELDHVSIRVSDVRRSARFYMQLFGSDAARDANRQANPGSRSGELWFIRLGRSHLALAPAFADEAPGVDHYCLSVSKFAKDSAKATLAQFDQPFPDWPSNNVWLKDPDGRLIQLAPSANEPQIPGIVRNAVPAPRTADLPATAPFRAARISRLVLSSTRWAAAQSYYGRLLGDAQPSGRSYSHSVGPSAVILQEGGQSSLRIAIESFDKAAVTRTASSIGAAVDPGADPMVVRLRDPDGLTFEIAAAPEG